ncbi:MAG: Ppx/GppA phosphatase [Fibrobacteres bacterium]|nr:Ppx/GppA phosphatase [Fibrobacterota bacterium]
MSELFASVDIGTNSALLLIAERGDGFLQPVSQRIAVPRVGRNLAATGRISDESSLALTAALRSFLAEIALRKARLVGAVATQAFRIAANGPELLAGISEILDCRARIITGPEESRLGYLAVADRHPSPALAVLDIGGGSTEATRSQGGESIPIGAVNLLESCGRDAAACRAKAAEAFRGKFRDWSGTPDLVAVGGTATALAMLELKLPGFDSAAIEGLEIGRARIGATIDLLAGLSEEAKLGLPGMEKSRADILMPGLCILEAFLDAVGAARFRVSDRGVRYGIILDWLAAAGGK